MDNYKSIARVEPGATQDLNNFLPENPYQLLPLDVRPLLQLVTTRGKLPAVSDGAKLCQPVRK